MLSVSDTLDLINKNKWNIILKYLINGKMKRNMRLPNNNLLCHIACINNENNVIKYYLKYDEHLLGILNDDNENCFHLSAKLGYNDLLKLMINRIDDKNIILLQGKKDKTILHFLANRSGKIFDWVLEWILNNISDKEFMSSIDKNRQTILNINIYNCLSDTDIFYSRIFKIVTNGLIDLNNTNCIIPLIQSIEEKKSFISKLLIKNGADVNILTNDFLNPLLVSSIHDECNTIRLLIETGVDINYTGPEGDNNPLNIFLNKGNNKMIELFIDNGFNINKPNRYGETSLHKAFYSNTQLLSSIIYKLLFYGELNIKDNNNTTPLHLFLRKYQFTKYKELLEEKNLDIFVEDNKWKKPIDYIVTRHLPEFLNVVSRSFYNNIDTKKKNVICGKNDIGDRVGQGEKEKCVNNIRDFIMKNNKSIAETVSDDNIDMILGPKSNYGQFNADIMHNVIYTVMLLNKYKNVGIPFQFYEIGKASTKMMLLETSNVLDHTNTKGSDILSEIVSIYYESFFEIAPYLIVWKNDNLNYIDGDIDFYTRHALNSNKIRFIYFKLTLISSGTGTHANIIIFDKKTGILERFEPYGIIPYLSPNKLDKLLEKKLGSFLSKYLDKHNKKLIYLSPKDVYDNIGFQIISNDGNSAMKKLGDPAGYCLAWTYWYLEMRLKNPNIHPKKLISQTIDKIKGNGRKEYRDHVFIDFIRNYASKLDNEKNKYLESIGINKHYLYNLHFNNQDNKKVLSSLITSVNNNVLGW
jgi:ankyrin repeat protein